MASQRQRGVELKAIYRLEFYKKQNNWKFTKTVKEEKVKEVKKSSVTPTQSAKILNETYCIETGVDNEESVLNNAFLNDESDASTQMVLSAQSLDPISACQECINMGSTKAQNPWAHYVDEGIENIDEQDRPMNNWMDEDCLEKCSGDNEFQPSEWSDGMVWINSEHPQAWTGDMPTPVNFIEEVEGTDQTVWSADHLDCGQLTPWPDDQLWVPEIWDEDRLLVQSLETVEEFLEGAHSATHSSEVELVAPAEPGGGGAGAGRASCLEQLLLGGRRQGSRSTLSLEMCTAKQEACPNFGFEAFPKNEAFAPFIPRPHTVAPWRFYDDMTRPAQFVGRGRGRLA